MMIMVAISVFATIGISYFSSRVSSGYAKDLRKVVYSNVLKFSNHELNKISRSSLITRSTNDINQLQNLLSMMLICFQDCFSFNAHYDLIFKSDDSSNIIFWGIWCNCRQYFNWRHHRIYPIFHTGGIFLYHAWRHHDYTSKIFGIRKTCGWSIEYGTVIKWRIKNRWDKDAVKKFQENIL